MLEAMREFSFARLCKRKNVVPKTNLEHASLITRCPACPHVGVNMAAHWRNATIDQMYARGALPLPSKLTCSCRFLHALYIVIDGNFHQNLKNKRRDHKDFPLTLGAAYFANEDDWDKYTTALGDVLPEVRNGLFLPRRR